MNPDINETELDRRALAISVWENEGGSRAPGTPDGQFGRRVERDRSWTVYHVFPGILRASTARHRPSLADRRRPMACSRSIFATPDAGKSGTPGPRKLSDPRVNHDIGLSQSFPKFR